MEEIWKDIKNFEGYYQISNKGRVKSLERMTEFGCASEILTKEKILKHSFTRGYPKIALRIGEYKEYHQIHCLVWDYFGDTIRDNNIHHIDHINNIKDDNRIENLQLLTPQENVDKMYAEKYKRLPKGVSFITTEGKYRAQYRAKSGVVKFIGRYATPEEAHKAYINYIDDLETNNVTN